MIARSMHAGKPFTLSKDCEYCCGYQLCYGKNLLVVNEEDVTEEYDITLYDATAFFTEGGVLDRMLRGAVAKALTRFSIPYYHTKAVNMLDLYGATLPGIPLGEEPDFTLKPGSIIVMPQLQYIRLLGSVYSGDELSRRLMEESETLVAMLYSVETLMHIAFRKAEDIARNVEKKYGVPADIVASAIEEAYHSYAARKNISEMMREAADIILEQINIDWDTLIDIEGYMTSLVYEYVEMGDYYEPDLVAIVVYRRGEIVARSCEAARMVYKLLPERDQKTVREACLNTS